jgi:dolichol-phosphate mannosyltransferase
MTEQKKITVGCDCCNAVEKEKNFLSAVVYVCNDEARIGDFLSLLAKTLDENFEQYEIICVNDASTDGSVRVIRDNAASMRGIVSVVNLSYQQGLEAAMNAGIDLAIGDFVFEFDSTAVDYPPSLVMDIYRRSLEGFDIVAACGTGRKFSSSLFYWLFNRSARMQYQLRTETFRVLSRRAINRIHSMSRTIPFRKALYANCGLKMDSLSYRPLRAACKGRSDANRQYRFSTALDSIVLFTNLAFNISFVLALLMMAATLAGGIYVMLIFLLGKPVAGYTTMMLLITASFFGVFAILAVILKYLSILVNLVFSKQKYMIESIEKIPRDPSGS